MNGRNGDNRGRRRGRRPQGRYGQGKDHGEMQGRSDGRRRNERGFIRDGVYIERPRWTAPVVSTEPLPSPDCPCCGRPIQDIQSALTDRNSGLPAHFDCVMAKLSETEKCESGEVLSYLGGGRFGIVKFQDDDSRKFTIKKIIEWENKDERALWRGEIADRYSIT